MSFQQPARSKRVHRIFALAGAKIVNVRVIVKGGRPMNSKQWNPGTLLQLSGSYWQAFTLHTGVKLDIFSILSGEVMDPETVADRIQADLRGTTTLLNALAAMGLLEKSKGSYTASPEAASFLNKDAPGYVGHMILHHHHLAGGWSRMDEVVRTGRPLSRRVSSTSDEDRRRAFLMGMYNLASQQAPQIAALVDLAGHRHLIDVGGGPGTYAIHFCRHNPDLNAVVLDLPTTRPFAEECIDQHGLSRRIRFSEGNFLTTEIPGRYDVAWLSHILHAESPEDCRRLISKTVGSLEPGGLILIHEFFLNANMDGPLFPALFALNMLQGTDRGQSYSEDQVRQMLQSAGVSDIQRLKYAGPTESGILQGVFNPNVA
jgi:predicted O-methyltransferase YrrM